MDSKGKPINPATTPAGLASDTACLHIEVCHRCTPCPMRGEGVCDCLVYWCHCRCPLAKPLSGVLFLDYGTDLDSGESVLGDPAGTRGKPGR